LKIIKINAIGSTNDFLKDLAKQTFVADGTVVRTEDQTQGRGQMGASWHFEPGKSLAFSVFKRFPKMPLKQAYAVNFAVSLGVKKALEELGMTSVTIKWPNDILAEGGKICGILIENQFREPESFTSIIGIGINVNNSNFHELPKATSLFMQRGMPFSLDEVFETVVNFVLKELNAASQDNFEKLKNEYETYLFRKGKVSTFEGNDGAVFSGIIKGVSSEGLLQVLLENNLLREFQLKELKLMY
tara:strand:- start:20090 stop:20821 length:732 start_codon:yes stop_codon:yes gene_type:complete